MPFQPGKSGNPSGRPSVARQQLHDLLEANFTPARRKKVLLKLIKDAEAGNHDARTLLLAYAYGKPTERQELIGDDGGPLTIRTVRVLRDNHRHLSADPDPDAAADRD